MKKILIAMSGGVDSSVAALLLKEERLDCAGAMMRLFSAGGGTETGRLEYPDDQDARAVASSLGVPFYVLDFADAFARRVIGRFVSAYQGGATPNPCVDCNRYIKFGRFLDASREMGYDHIATGHYARIERRNGRFLLKKGLDISKDQSYVLYSMTQEQLASTLFPLGSMTKSQVRAIASEKGFASAGKRESQDICFVPDGDYAGFIERRIGAKMKNGRFIDTVGNDLGEHKGIYRYTVGQRRGIGIPGAHPMYVCAVRPESNSVVVGTEDKLYSNDIVARNINLIPVETIDAPLRVTAKIRYKQPEQQATVWQPDADTLRVEFDKPQRAITRGQAVVLYDGDTVIGGGTIV